MILRPIWPIKLAFSSVWLLHRPSKSIWQKPAHCRYASTFTVTSFTRSYSRKSPPTRNLETFNVLIRQSHSATSPRVRGPFTVSTFDPTALQPSDYLDISNRRTLSVHLSTHDKAADQGSRLLHDPSSIQTECFPPNTKGFFYFHKPPSTYPIQSSKGAPVDEIVVPIHPAAGQLRFRLLDTPDPTKFAEGRDFATKRAPFKPWAISLLDISQYPGYSQIYEALTSPTERDNIQAFFARSREIGGNRHCTSFRHATPILDNILEPFIIDFSCSIVTLCLLDTDCVVKCFLTKPCVVLGTGYFRSPYSGKALCRFEPAIKRGLKHAKAGLTVRVLKWLEYPNPTDFVVQEEGQLVKKCNSAKEEIALFINADYFYIPPASMELLSRAFPISNPFSIQKRRRSA